MSALGRGNGQVFFIGVARYSDKVIVAGKDFQEDIPTSTVQGLFNNIQGEMTTNQPVSFASGNKSWHMRRGSESDPTGLLIYVVGADKDYPIRVASQCHEELSRTFMAKAGKSWESAKEGGLNGSCEKLLSTVIQKYDDLATVSPAHAVQGKIDNVTNQMSANIKGALANTEKLEDMEAQTEALRNSAGIFKNNAHVLRKKMWWKDLKMRLLIAGIAIAIITAIGLIIAAETGAFESDDDKESDK